MAVPVRRRPSDLFGVMFDRDFRDLLERFDQDVLPSRNGFIPPIDVFHDDEKVTIRAEVPGMPRENLDVHVDGDLLTISGRKEHVQSSGYHQIESRCGSFQRIVTLPHTVDAEKISAAFRDGVLEVVLPLKPEARPKQIAININ